MLSGYQKTVGLITVKSFRQRKKFPFPTDVDFEKSLDGGCGITMAGICNVFGVEISFLVRRFIRFQ